MTPRPGQWLTVLTCLVALAAPACGGDDDSAGHDAGATPDASQGWDAGTNTNGQGWQPPVAVPMPEFGIEETVENVYGDAAYFTHYVDNTDPAATDEDNEQGSPQRPRLTLPNDVPAGSVVEIHGGPYESDQEILLRESGTADTPIFLRGAPGAPPVVNRSLSIRGAYIVVEGIDFDFANGTKNVSIRPETATDAPEVHHVAVRGCELHNYNRDLGATGNSSMIGVSNSHNDNDVYVHDVVIWANYIHDNGDATLAERDIHGVGIGANVQDLWMVDNHLHHNSGDAVQVQYYRAPPYHISNRIYIGRNHMHDDQENAVDLKGCRDVVISENRIHSYQGLSQGVAVGYGTGIVVHEADEHAEQVLVIYNDISECTSTGITVSHETTEIYLVGNVIHDNHFEGEDSHDPTSPWYPGVGLRVRNIGTSYVLGNLVYDTHHGIVSTATTPDALEVRGNIVSALHSGADGGHLIVEDGTVADTAALDHNLFYQSGDPIRVRLGSDNYADVASLPAQAVDCLESDPLLVDPGAGDYRPGPGSPAVDTGVDLDSIVQAIFGVALTVDIEGEPRPQGGGWDMGPFER